MAYITVDPYYKIDEYNRMLQALQNNGVEYSLWIDTKPPHNWYIKVDDENMPKFVDYDVIPKSRERYLISIIYPQKAQDAYLLMRRDTDAPTDYSRFVINDYWGDAMKSDYFIIFKSKSPEDVRKISKELGVKIYDIGTHRWRLFMGFNKYIKGHISQDQFLYEADKTKKKEFNTIGGIEAEFNYQILRTDKIDKKGLITDYWKNGVKVPATHYII